MLNADVFYIGLGTKKFLINFINKTCGLDLNPYACSLKLTLDDENFIFIESGGLGSQDPLKLCRNVQVYHCLKHHFLRVGKIRDSRKYAESIYIDDSINEHLQGMYPTLTHQKYI